MHDTFNNEKKFNKIMEKSWYNTMRQEPQSTKRGKIKYCKVNN